MSDPKEKLFEKIKVLNETIWEMQVDRSKIEDWLDNFKQDVHGSLSERIHALHLLSQFMYYGSKEMRELLKALYRDLYKYPIVETIRKSKKDTTDTDMISIAFAKELKRTRFLGVGNPSESGSHLLYYFRQENALSKKLFIHSHEILKRSDSDHSPSIRFPSVTKYIFIDDFCGSGSQVKGYLDEFLIELKSIRNDIYLGYYVLFSTKKGLDKIRKETEFDEVKSIFELDSTYNCFGSKSRYYLNIDENIDKLFAKAMCCNYGKQLLPSYPLGFKNGQLLIGFHHNTPDNTLPIIWYDEQKHITWNPIFRRYPKVYGW